MPSLITYKYITLCNLNEASRSEGQLLNSQICIMIKDIPWVMLVSGSFWQTFVTKVTPLNLQDNWIQSPWSLVSLLPAFSWQLYEYYSYWLEQFCSLCENREILRKAVFQGASIPNFAISLRHHRGIILLPASAWVTCQYL